MFVGKANMNAETTNRVGVIPTIGFNGGKNSAPGKFLQPSDTVCSIFLHPVENLFIGIQI